FVFVTMYASMAAGALAIEMIFKAVGLVPAERHAKIVETVIQWNYTTILNIIFLLLTAILLIRFFRSGGPRMLKMMKRPMSEHRMSHDKADCQPVLTALLVSDLTLTRPTCDHGRAQARV